MSTHTKQGEQKDESDKFNLFYQNPTVQQTRFSPYANNLGAFDPVQSYIRMDRCGPNPNPEWRYILKTNLCNYKKS